MWDAMLSADVQVCLGIDLNPRHMQNARDEWIFSRKIRHNERQCAGINLLEDDGSCTFLAAKARSSQHEGVSSPMQKLQGAYLNPHVACFANQGKMCLRCIDIKLPV